MILEVKIPSPGESISEVLLARWFVENGDQVEKDQELGEVESDKATLPLIAIGSGAISILVKEAETVKIGTVSCTIDTEKIGATQKKKSENDKSLYQPVQEIKVVNESLVEENKITDHEAIKVTPLARKMMEDQNLSMEDILSGLQRITTREVEMVIQSPTSVISDISAKKETISRETKRQPMSSLRKKLAERLVAVKNETAMLTTFNEVDMTEVMAIRKKYQQKFEAKYGLKVGFMSFFAKAVSEALKLHPMVNAQLDGDEIVQPSYFDIGIAVSTDKGLMVPVLRNVETMSLSDIEKNLAAMAAKARSGRISLEEMSGGTFTITNGGVFGSMLSTPIINPPQSAILGMHNIIERPVAIDGKVEIRPIMYVALSYDHRIIDGKDSVGFLVKVKQFIEHPTKLLFGSSTPEETLLGI